MEKINYNISYNNKDLLVQNIKGPEIYLEVINTTKNYGAYRWAINEGFEQIFSNNPNDINLGLPKGKNSHYYFDRIHITDKKTFFDIYLIKDDINLVKLPLSDFNLNSPLVCICGHSGGGTSIVTKSLNYLGIHIGDDSGDFSNRKAHESVSFRTYLFHCFSTIENKYLYKSLQSVFTSYNYNQDKVNAFKLTDLEDNNISLKLSQIFPNIKFLSIIKNKTSSSSSPEGERFNNAQEFNIYKQQHPTVEGVPMFHLNWKKYFTDYNYVNKVLQYLGSDIILNEDTFNEMLVSINFNNTKL